jgi:hypothetical protein
MSIIKYYFWFSMGSSSLLNWLFGVGHLNYYWPFCPVHILSCGLRARRSFLQLIWLACVWIIWNERNHRLFNNAASPWRFCWTRSRCSLIGGWRRRLLLLLRIIITSGRTHCFVWVLNKVFALYFDTSLLYWYFCDLTVTLLDTPCAEETFVSSFIYIISFDLFKKKSLITCKTYTFNRLCRVDLI